MEHGGDPLGNKSPDSLEYKRVVRAIEERVSAVRKGERRSAESFERTNKRFL